MKTKLLLSLALASSARALVLTANFDAHPQQTLLGASYSENALLFTAPADMVTVSGHFGAMLFGGGGYSYAGNAVHVVGNDGWLGISAGGDLMESVSFKYGFDWSFYSIEAGRMTTELAWQKWLGGELLAEGAFGASTGHGGGMVTIPGGDEFDQLLLRSTATTYASATWNFQTQSWDRSGPTWSPTNRIAFDSVSVTVADAEVFRRPATHGVPDSGSTLAMLLGAMAAAVFVRRMR